MAYVKTLTDTARVWRGYGAGMARTEPDNQAGRNAGGNGRERQRQDDALPRTGGRFGFYG